MISNWTRSMDTAMLYVQHFLHLPGLTGPIIYLCYIWYHEAGQEARSRKDLWWQGCWVGVMGIWSVWVMFSMFVVLWISFISLSLSFSQPQGATSYFYVDRKLTFNWPHHLWLKGEKIWHEIWFGVEVMSSISFIVSTQETSKNDLILQS